MALIGGEVCIDTDDLEQPEYHYYCKAVAMKKTGTAYLILHGYLSAYKIENSDKYKWLADDDGLKENKQE